MPSRQAFNGRYDRAFQLAQLHLAAAHRLAIDQYGAGVATAIVAAMLGTGKVGGIAQREQEWHLRIQP